MDKNFNFKKSLGQNFLIDENIINKIVDSAGIDKDTLVIEIGPGGGAISKKIAKLCGNLLCYEIDNNLYDTLTNTFFDYDNVCIKFQDFLTADVLTDIKDYNYKKLYVVANLPYYITTAIINKLIFDNVMPDKMIVMVQKEVAERFSALPGNKNYNSLTVFLNYHYDISLLFDVSNNCFVPKPKVTSSVVRFLLKDEKKEVKDLNLFYKIIRDSFRHKRKTLKNNLYDYDLDKIALVLSKYNMDLSVRAENLSLEIFVDIVNSL